MVEINTDVGMELSRYNNRIIFFINEEGSVKHLTFSGKKLIILLDPVKIF